MGSEFDEHVQAAASRLEVRTAVRGIYADVERETDIRRPVCVASGKCCRFEEYGHRLFVTTMEMAAFVYELREARGRENEGPSKTKPAPSPGGFALPQVSDAEPSGDGAHSMAVDAPGCPFQIDKLCTVHTLRPFGCRMFFCDATSTEWQNQQYEVSHSRLKRLHETLSVPYFYMEWRAALRECVPSADIL